MEATMTRRMESLVPNGNPMQACIDVCSKCIQICQECMNLCLQESDARDRMYLIKSLQDCAEICSTASCFISRGSGHIREICTVCAAVCESCAKECGKFNDEHCKTCSEICSQCASECRYTMNM